MSAGHSARHRSTSSTSRPPFRAATPIDPRTSDVDFEPCAATASIFLYSQNTSIVCLHHDSLAVERRFERHADRVLGISVDNVSERGAGRLVVSFDAGRTAIVWDLYTGEERTRFQYYEDIKVAAWMKNGKIAFGETNKQCPRELMGTDMHAAGNSQGNVILFNPSNTEHESARTIFDPITALAPSSDCQTYAIGSVHAMI